METSLPRFRKQLRKQQKRKARRWQKALEALETPVALIFATDDHHPVPLHLLPLLKARRRIHELNVLLALARGEGDTTGDIVANEAIEFIPQAPAVLRDKGPLDQAGIISALAGGEPMYTILVARGDLRPAMGRRWSVVSHADLAAILPGVNLRHKRRRDWYVTAPVLDTCGRIAGVKVWSLNWRPLFERRIRWPDPVQHHAAAESES